MILLPMRAAAIVDPRPEVATSSRDQVATRPGACAAPCPGPPVALNLLAVRTSARAQDPLQRTLLGTGARSVDGPPRGPRDQAQLLNRVSTPPPRQPDDIERVHRGGVLARCPHRSRFPAV